MGYGRLGPHAEAFLGSMGSPYFPRMRSPSGLKPVIQHSSADLPTLRPTPLDVDNHRHAVATLLRHPCYCACLLPDRVRRPHPPPRKGAGSGAVSVPVSAWAVLRRYGNINPLSIDYACRPRLRSRLTQGGLAWPWNPWSFGGRVSHPSFATHACILTRAASTAGSPRRFTARTTLPYPPTPLHRKTRRSSARVRPRDGAGATASAVRLSPATLSARNHLTSELLRTLSRVAASKPTSWLSVQLHILSHLAHAWGP